MAGRPLKPAIDRRHGRPLPHHQANLTRADPSAINLSPGGRIRYYTQFPRAIPYRRARSHALLTRLPLPPKRALDLHVLSLPPAFVLSQDQTLKLSLKTDRNAGGKSCIITDISTSQNKTSNKRSLVCKLKNVSRGQSLSSTPRRD